LLDGSYGFRAPGFGSRKDDVMQIAQMNDEEKGGLPPPESKGGCHGA
jgi:hypothetical protein